MKKSDIDHGFVKWFSELSNKDISIAGGKGASLAEMYNHKFPIPPGFMITAQAYAYFVDKSGLNKEIIKILSGIKPEDTKALNSASKEIRALIESADMPKELEDEIIDAYDVLDVDKGSLETAKAGALKILKNSHEPPFVAIRSSATTEDLADASFAGQQESFLNVKGHKEIILKVKECFSSLFTARAIYYRIKKKFDPGKSLLAVVVQKMIDSDKSGVMFSKNPISTDDSIMIEAVWGLGEGIVSGMIKPDHYVIDSDLSNFKLIECKPSEKKVAVVRDSSGETKAIALTPERSKQQVLNNYEMKVLANYAKKLEEHYKKPQDIEFAISGTDIYIVQSRPITTKASSGNKREFSGEVLLSGLGASPGVASGTVKVIRNLAELDKVKRGDILVTEMTNPDMVVAMQRASGIVTDEGGVTSHAAIVSREMGIPAVVGTGEATKTLLDGQEITVDGDNGKVYAGKGEAHAAEIKPIVQTKTKIKVLVDIPNFAERAAKSGAQAVGLVRLEGIIASSGKHPLMFSAQKKMGDYQKIIYSGLKTIAKPFKEVWVRSSDIRSDEYSHLEGAPKNTEGNPMLGDHGIRFSLRHQDIFKAEIAAIKQLALEHKDKVFGIMVPQVISVQELKETKRIAKELGIPENVKIGIMVETPAAVQIINDLCEEGMQFISFGTNDLTQYTLAIDRNNEAVQYLYDETNQAVKNSISYVIRRCKKFGVETSICGQAGSNDKMVEFLVGEGIDSISVNADAAERISKLVASLESSGGNNVVSDSNGEMNVKMKDKTEKEGKVEFKNKKRDKVPEALKEDIEQVILKELDGNEYSPGEYSPRFDIPSLNDAIPISSEFFEKKDEPKEFDLNKRLAS